MAAAAQLSWRSVVLVVIESFRNESFRNIESLRNVGLTPDVVAHCVSLRKMPNAILEPAIYRCGGPVWQKTAETTVPCWSSMSNT